MKDFSELVSKRRSHRKFTEEPVNPKFVELILKAGLKSPSSKNAKPCHFIVIEDKDLLEQLSQTKKNGSKFMQDCSFAIVVVADPLISDVWIEDASIATIMMQLQAEDLGLGSCWVQIRNRYNESDISTEDIIKDIINLPLQMQVLSIIAIGNKALEKPPISDLNLEWEKVHIGKF